MQDVKYFVRSTSDNCFFLFVCYDLFLNEWGGSLKNRNFDAIAVGSAIIHGDSLISNLHFASMAMKVAFCCLSFKYYSEGD